MIPKKRNIDGKRVLHSRSGNNIVWNDPDIVLNININVDASGKSITHDFGANTNIYVRYGFGEHIGDVRAYLNTNSFSKDLDSGVDGNPVYTGLEPIWRNNYIYIEDPDLIEQLTLTSSVSNTMQHLNFISVFPNLKKLDYGTNVSSGFSSFPYALNLPNLEYLRCRPSNGPSGEGFYADWGAFTNLKWAHLTHGPSIVGFNPFEGLPPNLYYMRFYFLSAWEMDLADYFTGNRIGVYVQPQNNVSEHRLKYSGGAVFPSVISEDPLYPIDYIVYQTDKVHYKVQGDELSQFIIDFANQVTSVTTLQKRIRFAGSTPNTSYSDPSQSLFTTYSEALAHITETLGVTVQFT